MKSTRSRPVRTVAAATLALALLAACGDDDPVTTTTASTTGPLAGQATTTAPAATGPSLSIIAPATGTVVKGNVVSLDVASTGLTIVKADGDTSGKTGHYHVFIDRDPVAPGAVIPVEAGVIHSADDPIVLTGLAVGTHRLSLIVGDGTHTRLGPMVAETTVDVQGPSIDASTPATSAAGQPVVVTVKVDGLTIVKADGDTSGTTGHLHVFIDRDPTPAGQPIPVEAGIIHTAETTIPIPDLAPGAHTLWVVAGDGAHTPLAPRVMDKVTVTVS
ncbi:MAG: hypothetical protein QOG82_1035 [Actinomycetota bacterium]|jgi:hypothetical protein|nr:hypothetical protein [Actinomycetota bacterium]